MEVVTRRTTLLYGTAFASAFLMPAIASASASATGRQAPAFSLAAWQERVGSTVRVASRPGTVIKVAEVWDRSAVTRDNGDPGNGEVFTIRFTGHSGPALDEGIHTLEEPTLGSPAIFLSPARPGLDYLAVVNTWLPDTAAERR